MTLFAPTDAAFAALEASQPGITEALLADGETLTAVLLYHVVSGAQSSGDVIAVERLVTLEGRDVSVRVDGDAVFINGVQIIDVDIAASNGIIHVLDGVLVPEEAAAPDLIDVLTDDGRFSTLLAALDVAGLTDALRGEDPLTVFAPTDEAFAALEASQPGIIDGATRRPRYFGNPAISRRGGLTRRRSCGCLSAV